MPSGDSCLSRAAQCHVEQQHRAHKERTQRAPAAARAAREFARGTIPPRGGADERRDAAADADRPTTTAALGE
jgi:hypothetical protein